MVVKYTVYKYNCLALIISFYKCNPRRPNRQLGTISSSTQLEMPTKLGAASSCAKVSSDKLSVKYHNAIVGNRDAGAVQANKPAPEVKGAVYYFEIRVNNAGENGTIGIGFTKEDSDLTAMPGYGYK